MLTGETTPSTMEMDLSLTSYNTQLEMDNTRTLTLILELTKETTPTASLLTTCLASLKTPVDTLLTLESVLEAAISVNGLPLVSTP
jgi:hypothetical protein